MNVYRVFGNIIAQFVGFAIGNARFYTASGYKNTEAPRMMVPTVIILGQFSLAVVCPPEFPTPNNQGFIQQSPLF